jgi:hypothetical protein
MPNVVVECAEAPRRFSGALDDRRLNYKKQLIEEDPCNASASSDSA